MQFTTIFTTLTLLFTLNAAAAPTVTSNEPQIEANGSKSTCIRFFIQQYGPYFSCGHDSGTAIENVEKRDVNTGCKTMTVAGQLTDICGDALERFGAVEVEKAVEEAQRIEKRDCVKFYINRMGPYYRCR